MCRLGVAVNRQNMMAKGGIEDRLRENPPVSSGLTLLVLMYARMVCTVKLGEWHEEGKAGINFQKHGVHMPEAIPVFDDPYAITVIDDDSDPDEQRFVTIGMGATCRLLVVVYVWQSENIRIIPARTTESHERKEYEVEE
jgi:uncharacterized DUF497 family protein